MSYSLVPHPTTVEPRSGEFVLAEDTGIFSSPGAEGVAEVLRSQLASVTGMPLPAAPPEHEPAIKLVLAPGAREIHGEGYHLSVSPRIVLATSRSAEGLHNAAQTLLQLMPPEVFLTEPQRGIRWAMPCVDVIDAPRFPWRGAHLDVARHFFPKSFLLRYIDLLAMHKLNVFHLHLTDDQGWRMEVRKYPKLTQVGAWRRETMQKVSVPTFDGRPHGGYYTQDDLREVVAYAAQRHIIVVPEIEMPGHSQAAIASYPELGNESPRLEVATHWGIIEHVLNVEDATVSFFQDVLEEVLEIFPSTFIHIGGDECPKKEWRQSPRAQERMHELGLADESELQSWFIGQMDGFLSERGRRLVGWSEIVEGGLAPNATVMSWLGHGIAVRAATRGHDVVMTPHSHTYFNLSHEQTPLEKVYGFDPVPKELPRGDAGRILGTQGQMWTEWVSTAQDLEELAFPRLCALAEVAWSELRPGYRDFVSRLPSHLLRLDSLDVNYHPP